MRKFIIISLALLGNALATFACGYWGLGHNNYLFSVFHRELMNTNLFGDRIEQYWNDYTKSDDGFYEAKIRELAAQKGDTDLLAYLDQLDIYLGICDQLRETWEYPTKEQLTNRKSQLETMRQMASNRLRGAHQSQWALLLMRANMQLERHQDNVTFWQQTGSKLPSSVFRDMMENIYAGAQLHLGHTIEACEAFASQGDMVSVKWAMRKHRNLAGIQHYFNQSHDTPLMHFLVQDFVNNVQETIDNHADEDWMKEIDARNILQPEMNAFMDFARGIVQRGETQNPCLWQAAIGALQHLSGNSDDAFATLTQAVAMNGNQRMKDNARAIRIVASASCQHKQSDYDSWLAQELDWLIAKIREEAKDPQANDYGRITYNHYFDILDRAVHRGLVPYYRSQGRENIAIALLTMVDHPTSSLVPTARRYENNDPEWSPYYSTCHFVYLDSLNADEALRYYQWRQQGGNGPLERLVQSRSDIGTDFLNDVMGTKLLGEGRFAEALPYLRQVSMSFLSSQNIAWFMANRDWTKARWFECQSCKGYDSGHPAFTSNPKIRFCEEMIALEKTYNQSKGEQKLQTAYDLAIRHFQSSYLGDCWYLTRYGQSVYDSAYVNRPDPSIKALRLLEESKASTNTTLRMKSLYALGFIPIDQWYEYGDWNATTNVFELLLRPQSRRYKALGELSRYAKAHPTEANPYIRKCDVLKQFRGLTGI